MALFYRHLKLAAYWAARTPPLDVWSEDCEDLPDGHEPSSKDYADVPSLWTSNTSTYLGHLKGRQFRISWWNDRDPNFANVADVPWPTYNPAVKRVHLASDAMLLPDDGHKKPGRQKHDLGHTQTAIHYHPGALRWWMQRSHPCRQTTRHLHSKKTWRVVHSGRGHRDHWPAQGLVLRWWLHLAHCRGDRLEPSLHRAYVRTSPF